MLAPNDGISTSSSMKYAMPVTGLVHTFPTGVKNDGTKYVVPSDRCTVAWLALFWFKVGGGAGGVCTEKFEMHTPLSSCMSCRIHLTALPPWVNAPYSWSIHVVPVTSKRSPSTVTEPDACRRVSE